MATCPRCGEERAELWKCHERVERAEAQLEMARLEIGFLRRRAAEDSADLIRLERLLDTVQRYEGPKERRYR
jgi:hypothetical protein